MGNVLVWAIWVVAAFGCLASGIAVISFSNPFYSALALIGNLASLAVLYLLLSAEFVAAAQVLVYAGAVMVLYVFVVAYVGGQDEPLGPRAGSGLRAVSAVFGGLLFVELCIATLGSGLQLIDSGGTPAPASFGSPQEIGRLLLTKFLLAFEVASFLLLIAAVGAVVLARRRGGLTHAEEQARYSAMDMLRPAYTGTMAEAVGGRHTLPEASGENQLPSADPVPADEPVAGRAEDER